MTNRFKGVIAFVGMIGLALALSADEKMPAKKVSAKGAAGGLLQPQMEPEGGWDSKGTLGEKPAQPWSATTVGAAVDGKPVAGSVTTVTGEIIDFSCYLQLGKHGEKHKACGQKCLNNGMPIGLLTKDGALYMLMEEEHDPRRDGMGEFRKAAGEHFSHVMEVTGTHSTVRGYHAIYVTGFLKK
jgi:hypothetical protein